MNIKHLTGDLAYHELIGAIFRHGQPKAPRGLKTLELQPPTTVTIMSPEASIITNPLRKLNQAFGVAEFVWVMAGASDVETLAFYNENMRRFADWKGTQTWPWTGIGASGWTGDDADLKFFGAYGPPIRAQLPYIIEKIKSDPDTRQAVLTIWRPEPPATKDVPCTVALQFIMWKGKLELVTTMRSNDVWLGFPYDIQMFTRVQSWVAQKLGVAMGHYHHAVGSMHMYETNFEAARALLDAEPVHVVTERLPVYDDLTVDFREVYHELGTIARANFGSESRLRNMRGYGDMLKTVEQFAMRKFTRRTAA